MLKFLLIPILILSVTPFSLHAQSVNKRPPFTEASQIKELAVYHPISNLEMIGKGLEQIHFDSVSRISEIMWLDILASNSDRLPESSVYGFDFISDREVYELEIENLMDMASSGRDYKDIKVSPYLYTLMEKDSSQYVMLSYITGFTRKKGNMTGEMFKSIGIGIATMGMYYPIPLSYQSNIFLLIMDKKLGHAVFYRHSLAPDSNPLKTKHLQRQFKQLFKDYFTE